jgi:hypothetical protein
LAVVGGATLLSLTVAAYVNTGFNTLARRDKDVLIHLKFDKKAMYKHGVCFLDHEQTYLDFGEECGKVTAPAESAFVWGDSHAAALTIGVRARYPGNTAQYTAGGCPPIAGVDVKGRRECRAVNDYALREIRRILPALVVIHANWQAYDAAGLLPALAGSIAAIRQESPQSRVVVVGSVPQWEKNLPVILNHDRIELSDARYLSNAGIGQLRAVDARVKNIAAAEQVLFVSALAGFCRGDTCLAVADAGRGYEPTAWDQSHLTATGSLLLVRELTRSIQP